MGPYWYLLLCVVLSACTSSSADRGPSPDARPIVFRNPPEVKEGSGSAAGCEGVTAHGECQDGVAISCDIDRGLLQRVDCKALGEACVLDTARGAVCADFGPGGSSPCGDTGVSEEGFCSGTTAVYCDTSGSSPVTRTWNCELSGMSCRISECADGAFCCDGAAATSCGALTFDGVCDGDVARWCGPTGPKSLDCAAQGQTCQIDVCAQGAYCCGSTSDADQCAQIGWDGVCSNNTVQFCFDGNVIEHECTDGKTCQVDSCQSGAACCNPPAQDECSQIGWAGVCDGNTVRFCAGQDILEIACGAEETCQVDACGSGANCCADPCATVGATGTCDGDVLTFCLGGEVTDIDCAADGKSCEVDSCVAGLAECC